MGDDASRLSHCPETTFPSSPSLLFLRFVAAYRLLSLSTAAGPLPVDTGGLSQLVPDR